MKHFICQRRFGTFPLQGLQGHFRVIHHNRNPPPPPLLRPFTGPSPGSALRFDVTETSVLKFFKRLSPLVRSPHVRKHTHTHQEHGDSHSSFQVSNRCFPNHICFATSRWKPATPPRGGGGHTFARPECFL